MRKRNRLFKIVAVALAVLMLASLFFTVITVLTTNGRATEDEIGALEAQVDSLDAQRQELSKEKKKLEEKKSELRDVLNSLQSEISGIMRKKALIDENIELTQQEIANLEQQVELLNSDIAVKREEYNLAVANEQEQMELFKKRLREMEEAGDISYYEILFDANSFSDLLSRLDMIGEILKRDEATIERMEQARLEMVLAQQAMYDAKEECELKQQELNETQLSLQQERDEADAMMQELEKDESVYAEAYEENAALEAKIEKEIQASMAEAAAIEEKIEELRRANSMNSSGADIQGTYIWPSAASVYVTSKFGSRFHPILKYTTMHNGIDIGAAYGTDIYASDGGIVVTSAYGESYGNYVMIYHGDDRYTLYAHMSSRKVAVDDVVSQGDVIGLVGSTGYSTGPHIHFEIYENGTRIDPLGFFSNYILYGC